MAKKQNIQKLHSLPFVSTFRAIGLTDGEIKIYQVLLEHGELPTRDIIRLSGLKRGDCYNKLYDLAQRELIYEFEKEKIKHFRLAHPNKIEKYIEDRQKEIASAQKEIKTFLPDLVSAYSLSNNQPGVKFFDGDEGIRKVAFDNLDANTEILSYVDVEAAEKYVPKLNHDYIRAREKLKKKKRIIVTDSDYNRAYFKKLGPKVTDVRYLKFQLPKFKTNMQIYDNKVSYITTDSRLKLGFVIEDKHIADLHRAFFEYIWQTAKKTKTIDNV
jgi:HTH-type transcriptional regulator, sugar sensing transcriptional regulator